MSRLLAYTSPARGHLFPILPTLLEMRARGHEVVVYTLADELPRLRALGLEAHAIDPAIEALTLEDWKASNPLAAVHRTLSTWLARAAHELPELRAACASHRPDVLLVDVNTWGAITAAEASGVPFAVYSPYFLDFDIPGRPPFGLGLAPRAGLVGRLRDRVIRALMKGTIGGYMRRLDALRSPLGLPSVATLGELALRANTLLYLTAEPLEYTHGGWPEKVRLVGPGLWEPPAEGDLPASSRPVALVTCSTEYQDDGRLIEVALEALAAEDLDVVATTAAVDPSRFRAPPNATVTRFAPHGPLLRRAAVVVCHGGMGITQKALAAGVPVCVVPFGRDQLDVARHVEVAGAGASVSPAKLTPERLRTAIRLARSRRAGAEEIAKAFASAGGAPACASALEEIALPGALASARAPSSA